MICSARTLTIICALALSAVAAADDWPTWQADPARSAVSAENLTFPLGQRWVYRPAQPPRPAWPQPGKELHRMDFDWCFQPVVAGGMVYCGSSADDTLRALSSATGQEAWRFTAGGPIRFAPTIADGKAYLACDDGYIYCLGAATGALVWSRRLAPEDEMILGNDRMVSRYPCRTGPLVADGVLYVTAGMWPTEGVFIYALDAATGEEVWCNDSSGAIYVDLPHPGASGFSGVAPQGYLLVQGDTLLVPTGRSVPGAYDRRTGRLLYYKPADALYHGGSWLCSAGEVYFNSRNHFTNPSEAFEGEQDPRGGDGMFIYSHASGDVEVSLNGKYRVLAAAGVVYAVGGENLHAFDLAALRETARVTEAAVKWATPWAERVYCMAMTGDTLLLGCRGAIVALNTAGGQEVWRAELSGEVRGLAISDGRLIASLGSGELVCFEAGAQGPPSVVAESTTTAPGPDPGVASLIEQSGKLRGYALVLGEPNARLAESLAAGTELHVVAVLPAGDAVAVERERLVRAGAYGSRVWVTASALSDLPPYFADLVVVSGAAGVSPAECYRCLRPCGGALCFAGVDEAARGRFIAASGAPAEEVAGGNAMIVRGALPGADDWRYPWADGGRTGVSADTRVRLPMELLWFGGPGPDRLMDRHLMTSPPVAANGLVFVEGENHIICFDAYNGRELWATELPGVGRKYAQYYSSGLVADGDSVYAVVGERCHRLDQTTGAELAVYTIPQEVITGTPPPQVSEYMDIEWPETWQVIGPFPALRGAQPGKPPLAAGDLAAIPQSVEVGGKTLTATPLAAPGGVLDFTNLFGGWGLEPLAGGQQPAAEPRRGRYDLKQAQQTACAFAAIDCPRDGKLLIGAGANWWMEWFLDGRPVFDTTAGGNEPSRNDYRSPTPCTARDYLFELEVTAGPHVLAVLVRSGSTGWSLVADSHGDRAAELMPVVGDEDPNLPNLRDLVWGYVSAVDGLVLGSYNVPIVPGQPAEDHLIWRSESRAVFALNKADGSLVWVRRPQPDRTISNIEIAFGDGRLFLMDATSKADLVRGSRRGEEVAAAASIFALDLASGAELWRTDDVPILGERSMLSRIKSNPTHLFMGLPTWEHLMYSDGVVVLGVNAAWDATTGETLWRQDARPQKLPIISGEWVIATPFAYHLRTGQQRMMEDILTGEQVAWRFDKAYGCGPVHGCPNLLFFRSGADGFYDMNVGATTNFGGIRPNCTRSIIAAEGLLIHPEGYSGCACSYNYQTSLAMVPSDSAPEQWYVFGASTTSGPLRRLSVNLGAPGDQRGADGTPWLGFPRPFIATAVPAPVVVTMQAANAFARQRTSAEARGTDDPWLYSSGLTGRGEISVGVVLEPNVILPALEAAPTIDGSPDEPCWRQAALVPLQNTPFTMLGAAVELRVFRDADHLYFAQRRGPVANPRANATADDLADADSFHVYLTDRRKRGGIHMMVRRNGEGVAQFGTVDRYRKVDPAWQGQWQFAARDAGDAWATEIALPIATLTDNDIDPAELQLNCMSQSLTASGLESIFVIDPSYGADFKRCVRFRRVIPPPDEPPAERSFTVRLHFAETQGAQPGRRVFDVGLQGRKVLEGFDIVREAGAPNTALVREFKGVMARDAITIDLRPAAGSTLDPLICGVQVMEEG